LVEQISNNPLNLISTTYVALNYCTLDKVKDLKNCTTAKAGGRKKSAKTDPKAQPRCSICVI